MSTRVGTMTAAVVGDGRSVRMAEVSLPEPGPSCVLVRIEGCGVCASSLPVWEGRPWFRYPLEPGAPGHEGWGVVEATGADVQQLVPGDRVALLSQRAFAEFDVAPEAHCVAVPKELDGGPVPGEPLGCAVNIFDRARIHPGQRVAIVGVGYLGSLLALLCRQARAEVVCIRRETRVAGTFERVIEAAGTQDALDTAARLVSEGGRLTIAGFHQDGPRTVDMQSWNWRGIDVINAHERDPAMRVRGMRDALNMLADGRFDPSPLHTDVFPLARLAEAFEAARTRPAGFVKALVCP